MTTLYVVLKVDQDTRVSEMQGVFSSEEIALKVCEGHWNYMIGPIELDVACPDETMDEWPGAYYPAETVSGVDG